MNNFVHASGFSNANIGSKSKQISPIQDLYRFHFCVFMGRVNNWLIMLPAVLYSLKPGKHAELPSDRILVSGLSMGNLLPEVVEEFDVFYLKKQVGTC